MISSLAIKKIKSESLILISLIAVSIISPIAVHFVGLKGTEFLPIFFALSIGTFILSPIYLIALSILSPLLNYLIFQMPNVPVLYFLMFEGIVYSLLISAIKHFFKNTNYVIILSILSFIAARFSSILLLNIFNYDMWFNSLINGYKGIILNSIYIALTYIIINKKGSKHF